MKLETPWGEASLYDDPPPPGYRILSFRGVEAGYERNPDGCVLVCSFDLAIQHEVTYQRGATASVHWAVSWVTFLVPAQRHPDINADLRFEWADLFLRARCAQYLP